MSQEAEANIEVDPVLLENDDSDYASSGYETSTQSLSSSIHEYIFENGRRYHAYFGADKNPLPTDEAEQDRMDMYHEIALQLYDGRLHLAPLNDPQRVLDIGTGTGIWAIDMADTYPSAEVIGIDLSPTQPGWVPPNCRFEVDDAEQDWTFQPNLFDFIHARNIAQGVSNWPRLVSQAYRCTKPGGYVELSEVGQTAFCDDGTMADDNPIKVYFEIITDAMIKFGRPPVGDNTLRENLESAGFVDIKTDKKKEPIGPWAKDKRLKNIGAMTLLNGQEAFHSYGMMAFTRILGMETEAAEKLCRDAVQAMYNKNHHVYFCNYVAYGRKPAEEEEAAE